MSNKSVLELFTRAIYNVFIDDQEENLPQKYEFSNTKKADTKSTS